MHNELDFVPNILLCCDETEFVSKVWNKFFNIVGHVQFSGEIDGKLFDFVKDGKVLLNGELQDVSVLDELLRGSNVNFLIFSTCREQRHHRTLARQVNLYSTKFATIEYLKSLPRGFFYDLGSEVKLLQILNGFGVKTLLDVDGYFSQGKLFIKGDTSAEIDGISEEPLPPIYENLYTHAYKNLEDVGYKHYDAVLVAERKPHGFDSMVALTENFSDKVITFARRGSELEKYLDNNPSGFDKIERVGTWIGGWYFLTRRKPPEDFGMYVVTHKPTPHEGKLPKGYTIIQAGGGDDLGYLRDNTGDNISHLNLYINEITALYWMWKHTSHTVIGLCHYRRFFTESPDATFAYDKILTEDAALKVLQDYDIILRFYMGPTQKDLITTSCGENLFELGAAVTKKYLLRSQPDYIDAFEQVMSAPVFCMCNVFVTRRHVFDAYCKWLFSFLIDATDEVLRINPLENLRWTPRRLMSFLAERMLQVWVIKNRLRIKHLEFMMVKDI